MSSVLHGWLLYYCTQNRRFHRSGRITKKQEGLVLQIVTWGVLVHGYKNTERASYYGL